MTDQLSEIRERYDAIIPGPWRWYGNTATDQVYLATTNRGRLIILTPGTRTTEYVYDHYAGEGYPLKQAREMATHWCRIHRDDSDEEDAEIGKCSCEEITEFLRGELDPEEGHRDFNEGRHLQLTRGVQVYADLRFPLLWLGGQDDDPIERRKQHGGFLHSYRECSPRYEVLGYKSETQWMGENPGKRVEDHLYREDFTGFDQPEATFIEHAPEDIGYLLAEVERLQHELASRSSVVECPECRAEVDTGEARSL